MSTDLGVYEKAFIFEGGSLTAFCCFLEKYVRIFLLPPKSTKKEKSGGLSTTSKPPPLYLKKQPTKILRRPNKFRGLAMCPLHNFSDITRQ